MTHVLARVRALVDHSARVVREAFIAALNGDRPPATDNATRVAEESIAPLLLFACLTLLLDSDTRRVSTSE